MKKQLLLLLLVIFLATLSNQAQVVTTVSSVPVCSGSATVQIPVKVSSFTAVGSISLRFSYTASEISSPSVVYKDPGLDTWNTFLINASTPGTIIISAYDPDTEIPVTGLTLANNTTLFTLQFNIGTITVPAVLGFVENTQGTWCEYGGTGPDYTPFADTPAENYYINGSVSIDATPVAPTLSSSAPASGTVICAGYNAGSATFTGGSGGGSNEYEYSIDGGTNWLPYTNNAAITTTGGTTSVKVRARRSGGACSPSSYNTYEIWTFAATPVAPALSVASPAGGTTVCAGYNSGSVTAAPGSGGSTGAADEYRLSLDGGSVWSVYTNGASITTTGATGNIIVQSRRTAGTYGCSNSSWNDLSAWTLASAPVAPVLSIASPANGSAGCVGFTGTVTGTAGSGGSTGAADEFRVSINGGVDYTSYTNGASINSTGGTGSVIVQSRRTAGNYGCTETSWSNICTWTINARQKISGTFNYYRSSGNILLDDGDITVVLYNSSDVDHTTPIGTVITDAAGYYEFLSMCPACDYDLVATSTHSTAGAINTTDAAQANFWGPIGYAIEKVRFHAGDVVGSDRFIGGSDAGRIQANFVNGTPFDKAAWTFWRSGFTILHNPTVVEPEFTEYYTKVNLQVGSDATANMYGLVTGDFNRSYNPNIAKSASSTLTLLNDGSRQLAPGQECELALRMVNDAAVGAVSLVLEFPSEMAEILGVAMNSNTGTLQWAVKGNELRISWLSPDPISVAASGELLKIKIKTTASFTLGNSVRFKLAEDPLNELADDQYNVIGDAVISIESIDAVALGIDELKNNPLSVVCYPNPAHNFALFSYSLPYPGHLSLQVTNLLGKKVSILADEYQAVGEHLVRFDMTELPVGIYIVTARLKSEKNDSSVSIKLIHNN